MNITYGSGCSGVESASLAWEPLGWKAQWFAEIEPFPSAVLAHHWPHVKNHGDMTSLFKLVLQGVITAPDVLVAGTPCQSFSVAGLREGLDDERGQLTISYIRLADAVDYVRGREGKPQTIITWENVPGVLSDKGNAFGYFIAGLAGAESELEPGPRPEQGRSSKHWRWSKTTHSHSPKWSNAGCVVGPKRTVAWRLIDAQYFGVAQRRRRVFLVASARAGFNPAEVLFESEGLRRDTPPSRQKGEGVTHDIAGCLRASGVGTRTTGEQSGQDPVIAMPSPQRTQQLGSGKDVVVTLMACHGSKLWLGNQEAFSGDYHIVHGTQDPVVSRNLAHILGCNNGQENAVAFAENSRGEIRLQNDNGQIAGTLSTGDGKPGQGYPAIVNYNRVRRLMPVEAERLQNMPDNHTRIPWRNKTELDCPDGPRYKAIGNSKAVPCVQFIGIRIEQELQKLNMMEAA